MKMTKRKKQKWNAGDIFFIPLEDESWGVGQVLDLMMTNVVRCVLFNLNFESIPQDIDKQDLHEHEISRVAITREQLDYGAWTIGKNIPIQVDTNSLPNEKYRILGWVGAKIYDAAIIEDFLNAYFGLIPWDDWHDPNYLDKLLISPEMKPKNLLLKNR